MDAVAPPLVSVVLPAFNRAGSIRMAVESILRQSFTDFELLVVDDGSTDGTMDQLADVTDPRLARLANPRNMGASAARNTGIRAARGTWIAFHDSDDEWLPLKLEKQMARLGGAAGETVACYCGMVAVSGGGWIKGDLDRSPGERTHVYYLPSRGRTVVEGDIRDALLRANLVSTQMLVARRDALVKIGGFDEALPALVDWDCVIRLAEVGPFVFVGEPLVLQFFSDNSLTRSRQKRADARARILEKHHALFTAYPKVMARQHMSVAGEFRRLGNLAASRAALGRALRLRPFDPVILAKWIALAFRPGQGQPPR
jgi:glycosyltransferase involved in cell wall biosynthesis